ncbi:ARF-binding protein [Batrachochytrium dendrobatidis]|nr:ARF-binding protein [Batrachochytrium dendrobatidis]
MSGVPSSAGNVFAGLNNLIYEVGLDQPGTLLEEMIAQACDPSFGQPNLSLNLEICDMVNKTQKTYPRDCAFAILKHVNRGNNTAAYLSLMLLDSCVKNCGYPFHLVIGSKEFLNELVRRFPEKPTNITATQHRILELMQLWNATLCVNSRYKEDFKHINDMYRLLMYKGYRFPELREDAVKSFNGNNNLKTEDELEEEDRKAHGVKLEELIRKGTPAALAQANELMKVMTGYDVSKKPDYKKEVNQEIERIESRIILLNDMLNQRRPGESLAADSTIEELYGTAKSAQTKLQSFIELNDDEDRLARLLELNDLINIVLQKYSDVKSGKAIRHNDFDRKQAASEKSSNAPDSVGPINLIDFDDLSFPAAPASNFMAVPQTTSNPTNSKQSSISPGIMDGISDLQIGALPTFASMSAEVPFQQSRSLGNPPFFPPSKYDGGATLLQIQQGGAAASKSLQDTTNSLDPFSIFGNTDAMNKPLLGAPMSAGGISTTQPAQLGYQGTFSSFQSKNTDLLSMPTDFSMGFGSQMGQRSNTTSTQNATFASPTKEVMMYDKNGLQIKLFICSSHGPRTVDAKAVFINVTPVLFTGLSLQIAVPKSMTLTMDKPTGTTLAPLNQAQITQPFSISNPTMESVRLRFKIQYSINGATVNEMGEYALQ